MWQDQDSGAEEMKLNVSAIPSYGVLQEVKSFFPIWKMGDKVPNPHSIGVMMVRV